MGGDELRLSIDSEGKGHAPADFAGRKFQAHFLLAAAIGGMTEIALELLYRQNPAWAAMSFD